MQIEIDSLLKDVSFNVGTVKEAKRRFADQLAPDFSIFDHFRSDEMALSKCLAGLLDPRGKHGQGSVFLRRFIETISPPVNWIHNFEICEVTTEKQANGQRRIDVHLGFFEGAIGIENKPWAGDQELQLSDYADYLENSATGKDWLLIYLCNEPPKIYSLPQKKRAQLLPLNRFVEYNYAQLVKWLEVCRSDTKALNVRIFIEELIKFVRININGELEMSEENETCKTVLASKNNLQSAFDITRAMASVKRDVMKRFHGTLITKLRDKGLALAWDENMNGNWKPWCGFGITFFDDQDVYLRFEFEKSDLKKFFWGIRRITDSTKKDPKRWASVSDRMTSEFGKGGDSEWWAWESINTKDLFKKNVDDWGNADFLWTELVENGGEQLAQSIVEITIKVQKAFIGNEQLLRKTSHTSD